MWVVNPLVPGSNPGGPTNTGQLKYDPYRPLRSHRSCRPRSRIYLACILPFRKASQYGSVFTLFHLRCSSTTSLRVSESPILHTSVAEAIRTRPPPGPVASSHADSSSSCSKQTGVPAKHPSYDRRCRLAACPNRLRIYPRSGFSSRRWKFRIVVSLTAGPARLIPTNRQINPTL